MVKESVSKSRLHDVEGIDGNDFNEWTNKHMKNKGSTNKKIKF